MLCHSQDARMDDESLECTVPLIRAWCGVADLAQQIRAVLLARPTANAVILQAWPCNPP